MAFCILYSILHSAFCIYSVIALPSSADVPSFFVVPSSFLRSFLRSFVRRSFVRRFGVGIGVNGATPTLRRRGRFDFVDAGVAVWRSGECLACAWGWMDGHESA